MYLTEAHIAILVPVYRAPEEDLDKFFGQLSQLDTIPFIFFAYEEDSCDFDFHSRVTSWCKDNNVAYHILILSGKSGLGFALNAAVSKIEQDFVLRHDLGDDFLENRINDVLHTLNSNPGIDILYTQAILSDGKSEHISKYPKLFKKLEKSFSLGNPICHPTVIFRRLAILSVGNYDPSLRFCEDLDLWLRAWGAGLRFHCLDKETIRYFYPKNVRADLNWKVNLGVRLKNIGLPNLLYSLLGILLVSLFLFLPAASKEKVYKFVK